MSLINKITVGTTNYNIADSAYFTCDTAAATANKSISGLSTAEIVNGLSIKVKFTYTNTAASPKLYVGSTGYSIYKYGTTAAGTTENTSWFAGEVVEFTFITSGSTFAAMITGGKPTIPSVNNGTLTIQKNGTQVAAFTANQSGNSTANITVPTKTSDLTNDEFVRYDTASQGLTDTQKSNARTNIGAGTSNLAIGTTSTTAAAGDHSHGNITSDGKIDSEPVWQAEGILVCDQNFEIQQVIPDTARQIISAASEGHEHGNIKNNGTIASTDVSSATGVLVYDSINRIQRATAANARKIIGAAPTSHASTATTYGAGTSTNYGHVKVISGDLNGKTASDGYAASQSHTHSQYLTGITSSMVTTALGYTPGTSNLAIGTTSSTAAAGNHAHGNIANDGTIASTAVTSATGVLVYDSNNKIQRATAANARSIIGAGTSNLTIGTTSTTAAAGNHNHNGVYQPADADLTAIAGLTGTSGLLKKTAANTWALDTNTYLTSDNGLYINSNDELMYKYGSSEYSLGFLDSTGINDFKAYSIEGGAFTMDSDGCISNTGSDLSLTTSNTGWYSTLQLSSDGDGFRLASKNGSSGKTMTFETNSDVTQELTSDVSYTLKQDAIYRREGTAAEVPMKLYCHNLTVHIDNWDQAEEDWTIWVTIYNNSSDKISTKNAFLSYVPTSSNRMLGEVLPCGGCYDETDEYGRYIIDAVYIEASTSKFYAVYHAYYHEDTYYSVKSYSQIDLRGTATWNIADNVRRIF